MPWYCDPFVDANSNIHVLTSVGIFEVSKEAEGTAFGFPDRLGKRSMQATFVANRNELLNSQSRRRIFECVMESLALWLQNRKERGW
jgi:hypothetical protein